MGCRFALLSSALGVLLLSNGAAAEVLELEPSVLTTDELVISTTRTPERIRESAAAVTVLTKEQIQRSPYPGGHQLDDLLRSVPGVHNP